MQFTRINMDELYEPQKLRDLNKLKTYNLILDRVHKHIKVATRNKGTEKCCWYMVPAVILGLPVFNIEECIAFVLHELRENGFRVLYTHPNLLFISWSHWVPDYVRMEYKKRTGIVIDGFGNEVHPSSSSNKPSTLFKATSSYKPRGIIYKEDYIKTI